MRLNNRTIVAVAVYLLAASVASADKLKGYLWEVFMAAAAQEVAQMQRQLKPIKDPELQAYVDTIGRSLVPK